MVTLSGCRSATTSVEAGGAGAETTQTVIASSATDAQSAPEKRGPATVTTLLISRSPTKPELVDVIVRGELPDACRRIAWEVSGGAGHYRVDVWSVSTLEPGELCSATLEPFEEVVPLGSVPSGTHMVSSGDQSATFEV